MLVARYQQGNSDINKLLAVPVLEVDVLEVDSLEIDVAEVGLASEGSVAKDLADLMLAVSFVFQIVSA